MSILIKGMKMPHNCFLCPLSVMNGERVYCEVTKDEVLRAKIAQDCPLIELPSHGDLIDRDGIKWVEEEFEERCHNDRWTVVEKIAYKAQVDKLPTIIPAEESNMDSFIRIFEEDDEEDGMDSFIRILKD